MVAAPQSHMWLRFSICGIFPTFFFSFGFMHISVSAMTSKLEAIGHGLSGQVRHGDDGADDDGA